jgi:hypothetical protein
LLVAAFGLWCFAYAEEADSLIADP